MKPVLQALVLAESIYTDLTGKKIIVGTFNSIHLTKRIHLGRVGCPGGSERTLIPFGQPLAPCVYINLTDVCNNTNLELQFVSLTKNVVIFETQVQVSCQNRLASVEIITRLPSFEHLKLETGTYSFEIVCEGEVIGSHRVAVVASE